MRPNSLRLNPTRGSAPRAGRWSTRVRRGLFGALASVFALVGLVAFATPSFAHDDAVTGASACASPLGTGYVVTWTISNDFNSPVVSGKVLSVTGGLPSLSATTFTIGATTNPNKPKTAVITQTLAAGFTPTTLSIEIQSRWGDTTLKNDTGAASIADLNCAAPPTQTLAGHIYLCQDGNPTTTEETGGTVGATGPQTVTTQGNPLNPINVDAGGYTMTATPPTNFTLVVCGGTSTPNSDGTSATESVTVPSGGAGVGIFYVTAISTTPVTTPVTTPTTPTSQPTTSPSQTTPTTTATTLPTTSPATTQSLAFTGAPVGKEWMFGIGALILGSGLILSSRLRLRLRRPKHAASKQQ
jgi:hypothetical protein